MFLLWLLLWEAENGYWTEAEENGPELEVHREILVHEWLLGAGEMSLRVDRRTKVAEEDEEDLS